MSAILSKIVDNSLRVGRLTIPTLAIEEIVACCEHLNSLGVFQQCHSLCLSSYILTLRKGLTIPYTFFAHTVDHSQAIFYFSGSYKRLSGSINNILSPYAIHTVMHIAGGAHYGSICTVSYIIIPSMLRIQSHKIISLLNP